MGTQLGSAVTAEAATRVLEPLAIIGAACRFPGAAENLEELWRVLECGDITVTEVPPDRWDWRRHFSSDREAPGRTYVRHANFIRQDIRQFDAGFFGISPREAEVMDPQQRIMLEVAWEAIEHAGVDLKQLAAVRTGVYVGVFTLDNMIGRMGHSARFVTGPHTAVASTATILSNRISHAFDLCGPSLSVDTACSSSLVAFHLACQALWYGDCDAALVGGVNIMMRPEYVIAMSKGQFLAADGRSKTFDAAGDGYGRGEGAGAVLLKPLSQARADGDRILALVRATGCNQDGRTDGITVPNGTAQQALITAVLARAGLSPDDLHYVEAHGTGTALGDPIETRAIGSVLGAGRAAALPVGSIKANIGHLEAASGMAGVIKLLLCLRERQVPRVAGLGTLNPAIDFVGLNLHPPRETLALPTGTLRMGINSFGYGGTNAHAILESAPEESTPRATAAGDEAGEADGRWVVLPVSARSEAALDLLVARWSERLDDPAEPWRSLVANAGPRRSHHELRIAFIGRSRADLQQDIAAWREARPRSERPLRDPRPVFIFTGMGPQWWGMARELLTEHAPSQALAAEFDAQFQALAGWSLVAELLRPEAQSRVGETVIAQSGNLLCQVLITEWLRSQGIRPAAMVGHSVGEVAVAWACGALSLAEAVRVSYLRAHLQSRAAGQGGMLAVGLAEEDARSLIAGYGGAIEIAAVNGPTAVTLAGDPSALDEVAGRLEVRGLFNRRLRVDVAYHSRYMDPILDELRERLGELAPRDPLVPTWSTVTGTQAAAGPFGADYWCRNVRDPVRFRAAAADLCAAGYRLFIEIGPHSVLGANLREVLQSLGAEGRVLSTLARGESDLRRLYGTLGRLYAAGAAPDWRRVNGAPDARLALPAHPWLREPLWMETETGARERLGLPPGPLCGERRDHPTPVWERPVNRHDIPWVADHVVDGLVLLPGAAFVDTLFAVTAQVCPGGEALCVEHLVIDRPMVLHGDRTLCYRVTHDPARDLVRIASREESGGLWTRHAEARVARVAFDDSLPPALAGAARALDVDTLYRRLSRMGLEYGPACRRIRRLRLAQDQVWADLHELTETPTDIDHHLHPVMLDAAFQALLAVLVEHGETRPWVPTGIDAITLRGRVAGDLVCHGRLRQFTKREIIGDLWLTDAHGEPVVHVEGLHCVPVGQTHDPLTGLLHRETFEPLSPAAEPVRLGAWLLLCEDGGAPGGLGDALVRGLVDAGAAEVWPYAVGPAAGSLTRGSVMDATAVADLLAQPWAGGLAGLAYVAAGSDASPVAARERVARVHALVRALAVRGLTPRLYLVTQDAQAAVPGDPVTGHGQAAIQGYGRVAHNEYPPLAVTMVDLDQSTASRAALLTELLADDLEDDVALRAGRRLGRRIHPLEPRTLHAEALAPRRTDPIAVELCAGRPGGYFWREVAVPRPRPGQALLRIHSLVREADGEIPLCGFVAQVAEGAGGLAAGTWLAGAAAMVPASHLLTDPERLVHQVVAGPRTGLERLVSLWADLHAAFSRVLPQTRDGVLLLFGGDRPEGQVTRVLAPLFGVAEVLDARDYQPGARGLGARLHRALGDRRISAVVFADAAGVTPQPLPLDPTAQVLCLGAARDLDVVPWLRGVAAPGVHRIDPLVLFQSDPARIRASLVTAYAAFVAAGDALLTAPSAAAQDWAADQAPRHCPVLLDPLPAAAPADTARLRTDGEWLITGGFGGFGLACAEWLAGQGAQGLILVGRSGPKGEAPARLARLQTQGVRVRCELGDVADAGAVDALCARIAAAGLPLAGVLHTAGVLADLPIDDMTADDLHAVMRPKIDGAWHLGEALARHGIEPRHFLLFSSIAASVGNARQANYVAANVALDAFAAWRRARGLTADCIAWGALGFGMGVSHESLARHFEAMGMRPLDPTETFIGFERVLTERPATLILGALDWERWGRFDPFAARSPKVVHLTGKDEQVLESGLRQELAAMAPGERTEMAVLLLAEALAGPLRMAPERLDADSSLADLGVDSLMAVEIQLALKNTFGVELSTLELMRGGSVGSLAADLLRQLDIP